MSDAGKTRIVLPADVDILLGRGKPFQNHPGNQRMLSLVDKYKERYQAAERKEKHDIVEEVMGIISGSGGRFLRRVDYENYWVEVNHPIAYRKVGHAFRSKARKSDSTKKPAPTMTRQRVEAPLPPANNKAPSNMEEMLLADLRMRRAALHQADLLNMNNMNNMNMNRNMNNMNMNMNMSMNMNNMNMNMNNMNNMNMNNMNMNNMNNIAAMAAGSQLERFLLPTLYNNIATAGLFQQGLMNPNFLAANAALNAGNPALKPTDGQKAPAAPQDNTSADKNVAAVTQVAPTQASQVPATSI